MVELCSYAHLTQQPVTSQYCGQFRSHHLNGDLAIVFHIVRQVHHCHAAGAQFSLDGVPVGEGFFQPTKSVICHNSVTCSRNREIARLGTRQTGACQSGQVGNRYPLGKPHDRKDLSDSRLEKESTYVQLVRLARLRMAV